MNHFYFIAQAAGAGLGILGLAGIIFLIVYSIVTFLLPFTVWGCLKRLTEIRDDIRALRKDLSAQSVKPLSLLSPSSTGEKQNLPALQRLMNENEKPAPDWDKSAIYGQPQNQVSERLGSKQIFKD